MNHQGTKTLKTERFTLRKITPDDAEAVFEWMGDPEVCKYERFAPHPDAGYSRGYIATVFGDYQSDTYQWGIELNGRLIGSVSVVGIDEYDRKAVMGYCLSRKHWSKGYATEAVGAVLAYLFTEVGINRIEASHSVNNPASGKVLKKAGFLLEGHAKEYCNSNVGLQDSDLYGLTQSAYLKTN